MIPPIPFEQSHSWVAARERLPTAISWLEDGFERGNHVGIQLSVQVGDQYPIMASAGLAAPGIPMRDDTLVVPLCASNPLLAAAAVRAMDQGLMGPADRLCDYLPRLAGTSFDDITIAECLSHSIAGTDPQTQPATPEYFAPLEQVVDLTLAKVVRVPDRRKDTVLYMTWPFVLVGAALETLFDAPLDVVMRQEVFLPLGMNDTWMGMPEAVSARYQADHRLAQLYDCNGDQPVAQRIWKGDGGSAEPGWALPTVGVRNPCSEMVQFYRALMLAREGRDNRWLSLPAAWAMTARHRVGIPEHDSGAMIDFGLGVELESRHYDKLWMSFGPHCPLSTFGHKGMSCYISFCDPDNRVVVAVYLNGQIAGMAHGRRVFVLAQRIYEDLGLA